MNPALLSKLLSLLPLLIAGAQQIHADVAGHQKKAIVLDAFQTAAGVAVGISPENAAMTQAALTAASGIVDHTVDFLNATGVFTKQRVQTTAPISPVGKLAAAGK